MNFFAFFQSFFLFILHTANKPFNKNEVQSHLHTAIYSNCPSYGKNCHERGSFFLLFDLDRLHAQTDIINMLLIIVT